ncbi:MAG: ArgE/DapE family deacylase [Rhodospirillaceae bacterium]|jgi:succinyl-diaminopimelate desuccinylase|nr:ArgE/DapE family deacylase [Rhodospirillaceae bacterium]MBT4490500.1 ArgE/DapE family deacylase [Rhodospirillaceae bacterium]MBT5194431.1 ArgE/DapE family deacylase [Rhodospirillaceae bacterium]MBT5894279.1 ArgE/DapE family deacylase [Rhodospirillaceae bacterium]MBT6429894.1 ArgE/DapE family deacylase [Rhodospirillaceae bacterium]
MTEMELELAAWLEAHHNDQIALLAELVKVPSDNPPGDCAAHGARASELLSAMGFEVEQHPVPEGLCRDNGMISATNLVIRHRFGDGPVIALNAHGDVVAPGDGWDHDPYGANIVDGWMYGRGAAVSKSDFATYAYALKALIETGAELNGTVELHLTYDEEAGGAIGPKWLIDEGISKPDYAISAGFSYGVITSHNGCLHLGVEVKGRSAHAAKPGTGHDALEAANGILTAIYSHRSLLTERVSDIDGIGSPQLNVGLIEGGINTNVVPDRVSLRIDRRMIPEEDAGEVEGDLRALINRAAMGLDGISVDITRIMLAEPLKPVGDVDHLAAVVQKHASAVLGEDIPQAGVPLYTDARHYTAYGIPTILFGAGPRTIEDANAHRANERLPVSLLRDAARIIALSVADMLA